ncbi:ATP-dependent RNA helicase HrpA [Aliiglaciecola sp. CAU 1673]|uniref:ATP-dependent RNA helicase HrpA n=1 Tax=Aliiglaciecola sp. CAU 1673 TaxID=3032595 RepID=UPI0023DA30F4|nr:ATP-dependent RNA helicase HrpA [Aliiglaciecola sp. CAU 1673]MDF2177579.1 ATP-dependent RNA helicase HrpA [Aliiglaciecola sp. CAU 1673]
MRLHKDSLKAQISRCMSAERHRFWRHLRQLQGKDDAQAISKLEAQIAQSVARYEARLAAKPKFEYPPLPVSEHKDEIAKAIADNQVVIIAGETGSGKTTQLPKICLELGRGVAGLIGHSQPRRLAARSVANRIAEELNTELGQAVGYKVRFTDQVSDSTYVKLMTDGILLAEIQQDRFLNQYDTLIIDEAHERSLNIDFILGYLKQLLPKRPDLKLIITSATIDPERFSKHFENAPIIQVSGRTYPVEIRYRPVQEDNDSDRDQLQAIIDAVDELGRESQGDILVFLAGEREIRDTAEGLKRQQWKATEVLPLYARLSAAEQNRIFAPHAGRRIVLATNVAETSLTVPGIKYVIDPGFARLSRYSYRSKVQRLPIEAVSQASANQRAGRCGRVSEGICIRLYSEEDYLGRPEFTDPEILRTNLASVILQMLSLGLGDMEAFPFVEAPDSRHINDGFTLLQELGATAAGKGRQRAVLTPIGRQIARLPVDPRYARMMVEAARLNCLSELIVIGAALSIQDPRERPHDKRQAADEAHSQFQEKESDFLSFLRLWQLFREQQKQLTANQLKKWCKTHYLNYLRMREWQDIVSQLKQAIVDLGFRVNSEPSDYDAIHQAIASGLLSHIGFKDKEREYLGARNSRFLIFPASGLAKHPPKWVMAAELVETSRLFARSVAKIDPAWLEALAGHLIKRHYSEPHWSKKQGAVLANERVSLFGLDIVTSRKVQYGRIDGKTSREIFIREALVHLDTKLNFDFLTHNALLMDAVETLEAKCRRRDILVDEEDLVAFYEHRLPHDICSEASFRKWWQKQKDPSLLQFSEQDLMRQDASHISELDYPEKWRQGNLTLALSYHFEPKDEDDGVSLLVPLPILNQLQANGFDWLVPGLREELIVHLIKSLPKRLRKNFVPAPDYAKACASSLSQDESPFLESLSAKLKKMTGVEITADEWALAELPAHLKMNFKVLDEKGKMVAQGRDLHLLQQKLQGKVKQTLSQAASPELEQSGLDDWSFGALEREYINKQGSYEVKAYPALVDDKGKVAIRLFDQPHLADDAHGKGLRRMLLLNLPSPIKYLQDKLPNKAKLGLYFNPFGQVQALIDDCIAAAVDALVGEAALIRDPQAFNSLRDKVRAELNEQVLSIALKVEKGLTLAHEIHKKTKGNVPLNMINAVGDIKANLAQLVYPGFVSDIGVKRLDDWNRYLQAIAKRLEKLPIDPNRDRQHQLVLQKVEAAWQAKLNKLPKGQPVPVALAEVKWMLQELRVSLFAQQLGTAYPISEKRIQNHLEQC